MAKFILSLAFLSLLIEPAFAAAPSCQELFRPSHDTSLSPSTKRELFKYSQPSFRLLSEYFSTLNGLEAAVTKLRPGQRYFDGGAGLGLAPIEIVNKFPGVHAIAANSGNYWRQFFEHNSAWFSRPDMTSQSILEKLSAALGCKTMNVAWAKSELDRLSKSGFSYRTGTVQDILRKMIADGEKIDLYTDLWGAYAYSADRVELLELIYKSLNEGGEAYLESQDQLVREIDHLFHRVRVTANSDAVSMEFEKYLKELNDPAISFVGRWPQTIVIRKIPGRESLDLNLRMVPETANYDNPAQFPLGVRYEFTQR